MTHYGKHPRLSWATPSSDDVVWHWFICNGPHGEHFEWTDRDLELLRRFIGEQSVESPTFEEDARSIAREALQSQDSVLVLKGIHVLTAIGTDEEILLLEPLSNAANPAVTKHVRTALFERNIRGKRCKIGI